MKIEGGIFQHMFDPRTLGGLGKTVCEQSMYDMRGVDILPEHLQDWVRWWNNLAGRVDVWGFSQPEPTGLETLKINARVYLSEDDSACPKTHHVVVYHWDGEADNAGTVVIECTRTLCMRLLFNAMRLMRKRSERGMDPWFKPEHFKHRRQSSDRLPG